MRFSFLALVTIFFSTINFAQANSKFLEEAFKAFKQGAYSQAIESLVKIDDNKFKKMKVTKYYLKGLCHSKLQQFTEAINSYEISLKNGSDAEDIQYEYGQALYAASEMEKSLAAFQKSAEVKYKEDTSLYYVAHIAQVLEDLDTAKEYYAKLIRLKDVPDNMKQIASFQLAEVYITTAENLADGLEDSEEGAKEIVKENKKEVDKQDEIEFVAEKKDTKNELKKHDQSTADYIEKYAIPQLKEAFKVSPKSKLAKEILKRKQDISRKHGLDPNYMRNGKSLPSKRWSLYFSEKSKYDSNITAATEDPTKKATQKDSYVFDSTIYGNYKFNFLGLFIVTPELKLSHTIHSDRDSSEVYKNDGYTIAPAINSTYEHKMFGNKSSFIFNFGFNHQYKDRDETYDYLTYGRNYTFTIGEKFKYFSFGTTTLKAKRKTFFSHEPTTDSETTGISFNQTAILPNKHMFLVTVSADFTESNTPSSSTNNYLVRGDYIISKFLDFYTLNFSFSTSFLDTGENKPTRGIEKTYSPGIKLSKNIGKKFKITIFYDYSKKTSDDEATYAYNKHSEGFEVKYTF